MICIDLDGTLLNSRHKMTKRGLAVLKRACEIGHIPVIATGRIPINAMWYSSQIDENLPVIAANGAFYRDHLGNETQLKMSRSALLDICKLATAHNAALVFYSRDTVFTTSGLYQMPFWFMYINYEIFKPFMYRGTVKRLSKDPEQLTSFIQKDRGIIKAEIYHRDRKQTQKMVTQARRILGVQVASSGYNGIEMTLAGVSKGMAMEELAHKLKINIQDVVAIGDSENDLDMLKKAGISIAMGNGAEAVKECADIIAFSNDQEGVAQAIERFVLRQNSHKRAIG